MENNWKVYCHTNKINDKKYIGITSKELNQRFGKNGKGYIKNKGQKYFSNAIKKHGWDNFKHEVLFENLTKEEACEKEIELIALYDTTNQEKGYNVSKGGFAPMYGRKHTKETKERMSKERIGENNGFYGKTHSIETKRKESYPIMLLNTMTRFESIFEAKDFNNGRSPEPCIRGEQNSSGTDKEGNKLFWMYYKDYLDK